MWCKCGHVPRRFWEKRNPRVVPKPETSNSTQVYESAKSEFPTATTRLMTDASATITVDPKPEPLITNP